MVDSARGATGGLQTRRYLTVAWRQPRNPVFVAGFAPSRQRPWLGSLQPPGAPAEQHASQAQEQHQVPARLNVVLGPTRRKTALSGTRSRGAWAQCWDGRCATDR